MACPSPRPASTRVDGGRSGRSRGRARRASAGDDERQIRRVRRQVAWLPLVFDPSASAVPLGLGLTVLAATGALDVPL
ncbi:hypothetical protein CTE05_36480 [Cellulomonas terrae]|uniref:Uncharacterized protein n=1 Tax=Cellulomonas terrae TaxID=311234 RepID=A0A511JPZ6_9CELL|nr:hypothetical protein CTE05_36480 [Cellulomonas terrae]